MQVHGDFSKSEDLRMEVNFSNGAVHLVLKDAKDSINVVLSHADFDALQRFIGHRKDQERERRIRIIMENPNAHDQCGFRPGSLDEKLFDYTEREWVLDL
jgi:hypothetical protein